MRGSAWMLLALSVSLALLVPRAWAHPGVSTTAVVKVDPEGRVTVIIVHDVLALALNDTSQNVPDAPMYELLHSPDDVLGEAIAASRERFIVLFRFLADGRPIEPDLGQFPIVDLVRAWQLEHPDRRLPVKMDIVAHGLLPPGTRRIAVRFPEVMGDVIVTLDRPGLEPLTLPLRPGEISPEFELRRRADVPGAAPPAEGAAPKSAAPPSVGWFEVFRRYVVLGFTHIIPLGADHALFVLGLFLLSPRFKTVVWQITAFTIAHSITLFLTTFKVLTISSRIIEPTIAATIAFIAIENLCTTKVHSWRVAAAFVFGLVHGMGFASALAEVGLPTGRLVAGVIAFNIGVEGGHLLVLAAAFLVLGWWRDRPWFRRRVAIPCSLAIAAIALYWMIERLIVPE